LYVAASRSASWVARCRRLLGSSGCTVVRADPSSGINHVVAEIRSNQEATVWLMLDRFDAGDAVSVGNKFAAAFARLQGASVFGQGVPIDHTVARLKRFSGLFGKLTVIVSAAQHNVSAVSSIRSLAGYGSDVVLVVDESTSDDVLGRWSADRVVEAAELRLTEQEASEVASGIMPAHSVARLLAMTSFRFVGFAAAVRSEAGLPPLLEPEPNGYSMAGGALDELPADLLISSLRRRGASIEAFEVCVQWLPEMAGELVREAAPQYFANGLTRRLSTQLSLLPDTLRLQSDDLMRWWFGALTSENRHGSIRPAVEKVLAEREAPELRALYAAAFPGPELLSETSRALRAAESPLTLRMHGFALGQQSAGDEGIPFLMKALRMAEALSDVDQVVAAATDISNYNIRRGRYHDGAEWAKWALDHYRERGGNDELRRLAAISLYVYVRLLTDELTGLESMVRELDISDEWAGMPTSEGLISTMGDWYVVTGDLITAEKMYRRNLASLPREHFHLAALDLIPVLNRLGKTAEARVVGDRARTITRNSDDVTRSLGSLASALATVGVDSATAESALVDVTAVLGTGSEAQRLAQAAIVLAGLRLDRGDTHGAMRALQDGQPGLIELGMSGWRLLAGDSDTAERVRTLWGDRGQPVVGLFVLGAPFLTIGSRKVQLTQRHAECLAAIADSAQGLSLEQLTLCLYGDGGTVGTAKALVSRLRRTVPVTSRPYKIGVPFRADFLDVIELLRRGEVRQAIKLYRGPLLPTSDAPAIVELRERVEEYLRQAVLASGDAHAMLDFMNRWGTGDLELLEESLRHLPKNDPKLPLILAQISQIQREWSS
jgi:tetratricopeptide (TPR) repeat protein